MRARNISYPHPVLGNGDDVLQGSFDPSFSHVLHRDEIVLKVAFKLKSKTLEKLVRERKAIYVVEVECASTFFRKSFSTFENETEFSFPSSKVRVYVDVVFSVRAVAPIAKYSIEGQHSDYDGFTPDVEIGDLLAEGGTATFSADKDFDPMRPAVSSFIAIKSGADKRGPMCVDYSQDKIFIKLSKEDYDNYRVLKGRPSVAGVIHASIVLPVLADAIRMLSNSEEQELSDTYWFKRLGMIIQKLSLPLDDPLLCAQNLLKNPLERCLEGLVEEKE